MLVYKYWKVDGRSLLCRTSCFRLEDNETNYGNCGSWSAEVRLVTREEASICRFPYKDE
jgi:hypothetical protein